MLLHAKVEEIAEKQVVITVDGSITQGTRLKVLDAQLQNLVENGVNRVALDLTGVDFMDSGGLGLLMLARSLLSRPGSMLRLCCVQSRVRALLKMTKTDSLLSIDESLEDSLEAIKGV